MYKYSESIQKRALHPLFVKQNKYKYTNMTFDMSFVPMNAIQNQIWWNLNYTKAYILYFINFWF